MKRAISICIFFLSLSLLTDSFGYPQQIISDVYVDAEEGNDRNIGTSPDSPWQSLEKLNQQEFGPGAKIFLRAGRQWKGQLHLKGEGDKNKPIVLTKYGQGKKPILHGEGKTYTILLENQSYWEIEDLEITNFSEQEEGMQLHEWEQLNQSYWASSDEVRPQYKAQRSKKAAILIKASDKGAVNHLYFKRLHIHGVNGDISTKHNGGIFFEIHGDRTPTYFDDLQVVECYIHDVDRTGVSNISSWDQRTRNKNINWTPSKNIIIRNNVFERTGANALIVRVADHPVIEKNLFDHCAIKESGNANFPFNCNNSLIQYNEARFTKYNQGDVDAGGFDSDYRCKNTVIQYNFSHHNEFGGILICCMGGNSEKHFNDGTIVRYNVFQENSHHTIRVSGPVSNSLIHNNLFLISKNQDSTELIWHKSWRGYSDSTTYRHNLIYNQANNVRVNLHESTANSFRGNVVMGNEVVGFENHISPDEDKNEFLFLPVQFALFQEQWQKLKDENLE